MKTVIHALAVAFALSMIAGSPALAAADKTPPAKAQSADKAKAAVKKNDAVTKKAAPARSNQSGATRGDDRASQVKDLNQTKKAN